MLCIILLCFVSNNWWAIIVFIITTSRSDRLLVFVAPDTSFDPVAGAPVVSGVFFKNNPSPSARAMLTAARSPKLTIQCHVKQ